MCMHLFETIATHSQAFELKWARSLTLVLISQFFIQVPENRASNGECWARQANMRDYNLSSSMLLDPYIQMAIIFYNVG